jgi:hypothetical protein
MNARQEALAELKAKQDKERAKLEREYNIREQLPEGAEPRFVTTVSGRVFVTYEVDTFEEAWQVLDLYELLDCEARESGCLSIAPPEAQDPSYQNGRLRWKLPEMVELCSHGGSGYSPTFEVGGYGKHGDLVVNLTVKVAKAAYGLHAYQPMRHTLWGPENDGPVRHSPLKSTTTYHVKWGGGTPGSHRCSYYVSGTQQAQEAVEAALKL